MTRQQFARIVVLRTKIISMGTFASATGYALYVNNRLDVANVIIMGLATLFVDMGTTGFNTFFDFIRGTDNKDYTVEEEKVLVHEDVSPQSALYVSLAMFAIAAVLGIILALRTSWLLIPVGAVCMATGYLYTGGPFPISRTPFGELFAGGFLGPILFLITLYTQGLTPNLNNILASLPFLFMIAMILSVNNACDRVGDEANGRRTLAIILGEKNAANLVGIEGFGAFILSAILIVFSIFPRTVLPLHGLSLMIFTMKHQQTREEGYRAETKSKHMGFATQSYVFFTVTFTIAMILARVMHI
jgi:1,4-dihydroxy-2-naphthoate octaprenyltransferase